MRKKGFTLIELLVVIAIIALLLSILMPALKKARDVAQALVCLTNAKNLSLAWTLYTDDNSGALVGPHDGHTLSPSREYDWVDLPQDELGQTVAGNVATVEQKKLGIQAGALYPYSDNLKSFHCPGDRRYLTPLNPSATYAHAWRSYSIASSMNGGFYGGQPVTKFHKIKLPSEKYVFVEEEADVNGGNWGGWGLQGPINGNWDQWCDPVAIRHGKKNIMGFADGHAAQRLWIDKRTHQMAVEQIRYMITPNNPDLEYMNRNYAQQK